MSENDQLQRIAMECIKSYISDLPPVTQASVLGMIETYAQFRVDAFAEENRDDE